MNSLDFRTILSKTSSMATTHTHTSSRPSGNILHIDKMEIFQPSLKRAKQEVTTKNPGAFDFGGISFGIGLVMGYRCLLHGKKRNMSCFASLSLSLSLSLRVLTRCFPFECHIM